ncbi:MAG: hypothetical protein HZA88_09565 [Verrucomicrobia bacterium]|nr:hypothetical protein [Verrucomicrobiota bacterium]
MPHPTRHVLKSVNITRIAVVKNPAVRDSEIVLMKSADAARPGEDAMLKNFGERLLDWVQLRLAKTTTPTTECPDMDLKNLKIEELESARPDLVRAIADKSQPAGGAPGAAPDANKADPFAGLRASLEALKTEFRNGMQGLGDRVGKLEDSNKPAPADLEPVKQKIEELQKSIATLSKAQPQGLKHGDEEPLQKSNWGGVFRTVKNKKSSR